MGIEVNTCKLCNEIWNKDNLEEVPIGDKVLYLCPDCKEKFNKSYIDISKINVKDVISKSSLLEKLDPCYKKKIKIAPDNMAEGFMQVEKLIKQEPGLFE